MAGLEIVINAAGRLNGERHAPELPIPMSAIQTYAKRFRMSGLFVTLVQTYDMTIMSGIHAKAKEVIKGGTSKAVKTT